MVAILSHLVLEYFPPQQIAETIVFGLIWEKEKDGEHILDLFQEMTIIQRGNEKLEFQMREQRVKELSKIQIFTCKQQKGC